MSTQTPTFKSLTSRECHSVNQTRIGLSGSGEMGGRGGMLIALVPKGKKQPKLGLKIKQAYGSTSCGGKKKKKKKVDTCFRILHQEDNKAVSSYTDRQVVGLTTQIR